MAWSSETLEQLAPILANGHVAIQQKQPVILDLPKSLKKVTDNAGKSFRNWSLGLPHPDAIGTLPISGKINGTQVLLKRFT
ncbi:MAG: hypothetical protein LBC73_01620 [Oscillospiraceae bacterium]|jgi:hypothetical protein|nr:hypothetical protein [Oscillospiraceae bacterium]